MTKIKLGDKVIRDAATANQGKVHLGDDAGFAPPFAPATSDPDRDANQGKVHLGDDAPCSIRTRATRVVRDRIRASHLDDAPCSSDSRGDKVVRDAATVNQGKVHLGDYAPFFRESSPITCFVGNVPNVVCPRGCKALPRTS